ncbi:hypothetical protein F0562_033807 [Nyssa sinensis]|uniref:GCK domain-containing protein n=1 Tax=Nyssa sinensis TaxID=561372 RepID=A0A5J5AGN9_9ASTE|nr:hypothetical protein F0562_033807 [Nyssa sinensis]
MPTGDLLSKISTEPSEVEKKSVDMSSSGTSQTPESKPEEGAPEPKSAETLTPLQASDPSSMEGKQNPRSSRTDRYRGGDQKGEEEEEGEEGECGFCLFMKGGGCKDSFIAWEKCIEDAEKDKEDIVEKCFEVTGMLKKCMEAHSDYYGPILQAEKRAEEEAVRELEKEKDATTSSALADRSEQNSAEKGVQANKSFGIC